jgi:protocatechuate 3,4-dioxygenase beta subunit
MRILIILLVRALVSSTSASILLSEVQRDDGFRELQEQCSINGTTLTDLLGPFYERNSPKTELMAPADQLADPTKRLEVSGRVLSIQDCDSTTYFPLSNTVVEAWYAGEADEDGNLYQKDNYRGKVVTNDCGYYSYVQAFPEIYPDRPIIHTHFRLSTLSNKELLVTQLYFIGPDEGYYNDDTIENVLGGTRRDLQAVVVTTDPDTGIRRVKFDVYLDVSGNKQCITPAPPSSSPPSPEPCGLLGLSIFCFFGCGLIRRSLGIC